MNSREREVESANLDAEEQLIARLKETYQQAIDDCREKIAALNARTDMQNLQSIIYQRQYQQALEKQLEDILDALQSDEFTDVADYLAECYENGYVGAMYDLQGQGIPLILPINQENVVAAVQTDSKLSTDLYTRLGEDISALKTSIQSEMSRGISTGSTWLEIAESIAIGMNSPYKTALNSAIRIARTEGHRIQNQSKLDAAQTAAKNGADVVKQWDATLDSRTRPEHRQADGQIRELDEYFDVGGEKLKAPGVGGSARNVCNCRCCMLQRARWALDEDELKTLQERAAYFGLDKTDSFTEFKEKYLNATAASGTIELNRKIDRKEKNLGAFSNLEIPLQKRAVLEVCKKYSIDTRGITFKIQRSENLLALPICGCTDYDNIGRIDLFPNAFANEEQLVKTILHEKCHYKQLKKYGKKYVQDNLNYMERVAYKFESIYYYQLKREVE